MLYYVMLCWLCYDILFLLLCCAMLCYVMSSYVEICYGMYAVRMHACMCACSYVCKCAEYEWVLMPVCMHRHVGMHVRTHAFMCTCLCMSVCVIVSVLVFLSASLSVSARVRVCVCAHVYLCVCGCIFLLCVIYM